MRHRLLRFRIDLPLPLLLLFLWGGSSGLTGCKDSSSSSTGAAPVAATTADKTTCLAEARKHERGIGKAIDDAAAVAAYDACCQAGVSKACFHLGDLLQRGRPKRDNKRAMQLYETACDAGDADACVQLARGVLAGLGAPLDKERSAKLNARACTLGHPAGCVRVALATTDKKEAEAFWDQGLVLGRKLCDDENNAKHCGATAKLAKERHPALGKRLEERAFDLRREECAKGDDMTSCFNLGLHFERGEPHQRSIRAARDLFKKACERKHEEACRREKRMDRVLEKQEPIVKRAGPCRLAKGKGKECEELAAMCVTGKELACGPVVQINLELCVKSPEACQTAEAICKRSKAEAPCKLVTETYAARCHQEGKKPFCKKLKALCQSPKALPGCVAALKGPAKKEPAALKP